MKDDWKEALSCATKCTRCRKDLSTRNLRILSVYSHKPICMSCKKKEEKRPDYEEASRKTIEQCMADTEIMYSDPGGYCYSHFYPFRCR